METETNPNPAPATPTENVSGVASAAPCSALSALAFSLADKIGELRKVESSAFLRPAHEMAIRLAHELCNHENSSFRVGIRISLPNTATQVGP